MAIFPGSAIPSGVTDYTIDQSLRFNVGDSPYLSRTPSAGNTRTWTFSCWAKRASNAPEGGAGNSQTFFSANPSSMLIFCFSETNDILLNNYAPPYANELVRTSAKYRDTGAWYHVVGVWDTTNDTADDRIRIYVNGEQVTSMRLRTNPAEDLEGEVNKAVEHRVGSFANGSHYADGYLAEVHFIDGQALDASHFGEEDEDTGQWKPIKYTGTYGDNGFYQKYQDSSALGDDSSGNGNDFTATNLVATDKMKDSPTNNFCTLNPLNLVTNTTLSEGNLQGDCTSSNDGAALGTMSVSSGKWYWEVLQTTANANNDISCGVMELSRKMAPQTVGGDIYPNSYLYGNDGWNAKYNSTTSTINTYGAGDIIGWALDLDGNTLKIYKNNSLEYTYTSGVSGTFTPLVAVDGTSGQSVTHIANLGQDSSFNGEKTAQGNADGNDVGDFYYSPPSGFLALCSENLPTPEIADPTAHMNTVLYTGNGTAISVTGAGFQPDMVWIKTRDAIMDCQAADSVRGINRFLYTTGTNAEVDRTSENDALRSFDSDGFTYGDNAGNFSGESEVSWLWKAGGAAVTNDEGSIDSEVSAHTTAGFSIVKWTGTGSDVTVGHGLSQTPELLINKSLNNGSTYQGWAVQSLLWSSVSDTNLLYLNQDTASSDDTNVFSAALSASVFSPQGGAWTGIGVSGIDYIAYCFHSVEGYSKVGTYEGNGNADGAFIYTGFRPEFVMTKSADSSSDWQMFDNKRVGYNVDNYDLEANDSAIEDTSTEFIDIVSNGFKNRIATDPNVAETYVYIAFAETPFKTANAR